MLEMTVVTIPPSHNGTIVTRHHFQESLDLKIGTVRLCPWIETMPPITVFSVHSSVLKVRVDHKSFGCG